MERPPEVAVKKALEALDCGNRIVAEWLNAAMKKRGIKVEVTADPPPPGADFEVCRQALSDALLAIRPFWTGALPPDENLFPWLVGNFAGPEKAPRGIPIRGGILFCETWRGEIDRLVSVQVGYAVDDQGKPNPNHPRAWRDGGWRTYVAEVVTSQNREWKEALERFLPSERKPRTGGESAHAGIVAVLQQHHDVGEDGRVGNSEPMKQTDIRTKLNGKVSQGKVSKWFTEKFGGHSEYEAALTTHTFGPKFRRIRDELSGRGSEADQGD